MRSRKSEASIHDSASGLACCLAALIGAGCGGSPPADDAAAAGEYQPIVNMRLVGQHDLQARSAYQPIVYAYGGRRILFVGHHAGEAMNPMTGQVEVNGLSVLDVTDPAAPVYLAHVPPTGPEARGTQHVQVCDGRALPSGEPGKVYRYPEIARLDFPSFWGVHTAKPIRGVEIADYADNRDARVRDLLVVVSEAGAFRCQENRDLMVIVDITDERHPLPISTFQVPEEPGDFCHRGGRFGPHSPHDAFHPAFDKTLVLLAYFNAGIRAVDIRNPFEPQEVARFIPEVTANTTESCITIDGMEHCDRAIQTNNVNIDDRGYIYALDRASTGLHIVELTGEARAIVGFP